MTMRRKASGRFELPISAAEAIDYFTPEGERAWVPDWNPIYPTGDPSESSGTVFTTSAGGVDTVWVVHRVDRVGYSSAYSRITVGHHAGTVHVRCEDLGSGRCAVAVEYDMTLLPGSDPSELDAYDEPSFAGMMDEWATEVSRTLLA
ncbi:MAG: SRPBCC family protein [Acidimicrobiia bacterium]